MKLATSYIRSVATVRAGLLVAILLVSVAVAGRASGIPEIAGFHVAGNEGDPWPELLQSYGLLEQGAGAGVIVLPEGSVPEDDWRSQVENGKILVMVGDSPATRQLGIQASAHSIRVKDVCDTHDSRLAIVWEQPIRVPVFSLPPDAQVVVYNRRDHAPLMAVLHVGRGVILWLAVSPGAQGYERFPLLLQTLAQLGVRPSFESRRLWAFYDSAYQRDQAPGDLARAWRAMGISSIHAGAWQYFEPHSEEDARLEALIEACHHEGILVYAWLELPHVSDEFWKRHPEWREKTALFKDARVDWRLLMNLANPQCRDAVVQGVRSMLQRFDWDGVNFAELYFDGVNGIKLLKEFTPLNGDVRQEVQRIYGFDPAELFDGQPRDPRKVRAFLDYRADLAARLQVSWIDELEKMRAEKPYLDLVLTHVDDRFDTSMRDAIGADAARLLKQLDEHDLTFIIEDPATVWRLGPNRYSEIARRYRPLTSRLDRLGIDINLVERERAYPTRKQTGVELAELIHTASESFATTMFYYTGSITAQEAPLLAPASSVVTHCQVTADSLVIESPSGVGVRWWGPAELDGQSWPIRDRERVWIPAGKHVLRSTRTYPVLEVADFTGNVESASVFPDGLEITYNSHSRAFAKLTAKPAHLLVDGQEAQLELAGEYVLRLPRGRHRARITTVVPQD